MNAPVIGITADATADKYQVGRSHSRLLAEAGSTPIVLPCEPDCVAQYVEHCDGFVLTGGDDPAMERWGIATHEKAKPINPQRQAFELALLGALEQQRDTPVLGVCFGMQLMALQAGGSIDQHLPDTLPTHADHWNRTTHSISGELGEGIVHSHHRQAIVDPGSMRTIATAHDGVIEAIIDDDRAFYLGVQWHPERTEDGRLGRALYEQVVHASRAAQALAS